MLDFRMWDDAVAALEAGAASVLHRGRVYTMSDVVAAMGYDAAAKAGRLDEYRRAAGI